MSDFYAWLITLEAQVQLVIILTVMAGVVVFLFGFWYTRNEQRWVRWVVSCAAAFLASLIVLAVVNIARLVWNTP